MRRLALLISLAAAAMLAGQDPAGADLFEPIALVSASPSEQADYGRDPAISAEVERLARALAGQHPTSAQEIIDWLEQTVVGWNKKPTPFVWNGKRRRRRERTRLRRLGGSGASIVKGYSIVR